MIYANIYIPREISNNLKLFSEESQNELKGGKSNTESAAQSRVSNTLDCFLFKSIEIFSFT